MKRNLLFGIFYSIFFSFNGFAQGETTEVTYTIQTTFKQVEILIDVVNPIDTSDIKKSSAIVGTTSIDLEESSIISYYPNPTTGVVNFQMKSGDYLYEVYSPNGKKVLQGRMKLGIVDLSQLDQGMYVINILHIHSKVTEQVRIMKT